MPAESSPLVATGYIAGASVSPEALHAEFGISLEEIETFRDLIRIYSNQDVIVAEGSLEKAMYLLRSGTVKVFKRSGESQKYMTTIDAVNLFGEMSGINDEPRTATVIAMSNKVLVYRLANPSAHEIASNPYWAELLITRLSRSFARSLEQQIAAHEEIRRLRTELDRRR